MRSPNRLVAKHYPWLIRDRRHVRKRVIAVRGCATPEQPASGAALATPSVASCKTSRR
jgi:hypothetical protein